MKRHLFAIPITTNNDIDLDLLYQSNGRANHHHNNRSSGHHATSNIADELKDITTLYNLGVNIGTSLSLAEVVSKYTGI